MDIYETDLPGVGKRFELSLSDGSSVVVVVHNTGQRELFRKPDPDADAEEVFSLTGQQARALGSILEGVHFQPVETDIRSTAIGGDTVIEWYTLDADSPLVGETLRESNLRQQTGVTVMAVQRDDEAIPSPDADFEFRAEDVLITIGTTDDQAELESILVE